MNKIREAWKAVLAFFAPGLALVGETYLLGDGVMDEQTVRRALIAGAFTSLLVYLKRNGASPSLDTSTPQRETGSISLGEAVVLAILVVLVLALVGVLPAD